MRDLGGFVGIVAAIERHGSGGRGSRRLCFDGAWLLARGHSGERQKNCNMSH
jgi:hypothetical protein